MNEDFYKQILIKQQQVEAIPSNEAITTWATQVIRLLYPEQSKKIFSTIEALQEDFKRLEDELCAIMKATKACSDCNIDELAKSFFNDLPELYRVLNTDIQAIFTGDPAARSEFEVIRAYPGFFAISFYRMAHLLHQYDIPLIPRILTEYAHTNTGLDIHPAAKIDA